MKRQHSWVVRLARLDAKVLPSPRPPSSEASTTRTHPIADFTRNWMAIPRPGAVPPTGNVTRLLYLLDDRVISLVDRASTGLLIALTGSVYLVVGISVGLLIGQLLFFLVAMMVTGVFPLAVIVVLRRRSGHQPRGSAGGEKSGTGER